MPRASKKLSEKATKLSDEEIGKMIELVEEHECLWKPTHLWYYNKDAKSQALQRIGAELGLDEYDVKTKLEYLRSYYSKELAKQRNPIRKSGACRDGVYTSKWVHFESMGFMRDYVIPRNITKTVSNMMAESQYQSNVSQRVKIEVMDDSDSDNDDTGYDNQDPGYSDSEDDDSDAFAEATQPRNRSTEPVRKRKASSSLQETKSKKMQEDELLIAATKVLKRFTDEEAKTSKAEKEDPDEVFTKHVANELKHITDFRTKQCLKKQILDMIFDAQFGSSDPGSATGMQLPINPPPNVIPFTHAPRYNSTSHGSTKQC